MVSWPSCFHGNSKRMTAVALQTLQREEPARLEVAAKNWQRQGHAATTFAEKIKLFNWAAQAQQAAATLRAMRAARLRYSQNL